MKRVIFCLFTMLCFPAVLMAQVDPTQADNAPRDVLLVLDNSGSMKQNDPARLTAEAVKGFIARQKPGTRVGILLFADNPRLVAPLVPVNAQTRNDLLAALEQLNYSGRWTETAEAIERAIYELRVNGRDQALQSIVLMTDGILDTGNAARDQQRMQWLRNSLVPEAQANNIAIFGLAFTEQADFQLLQFLAQRTGGEYFRALTPQDIAPVLDRIDFALATSAKNLQVAQSSQSAQIGAATTNTMPPQASESAGISLPADTATTTAPERIIYSGPAAPVNAPPTQAATTPSAKHLVLWVLLVTLVLFFMLAGAGWWLARHWNLAGLFKNNPSTAAAGHGPPAILYDVHDPSDIKRYELTEQPAIIGRVTGSDPSMDYIVVEERTIGRWHATIERRGQSFWVRDEGSINGTYVNDARVTTEHPLKHGDMLRVHKHEFEFVIPELFDSDRTLMADERTKARAIQTARPTTTSRHGQTARG